MSGRINIVPHDTEVRRHMSKNICDVVRAKVLKYRDLDDHVLHWIIWVETGRGDRRAVVSMSYAERRRLDTGVWGFEYYASVAQACTSIELSQI